MKIKTTKKQTNKKTKQDNLRLNKVVIKAVGILLKKKTQNDLHRLFQRCTTEKKNVRNHKKNPTHTVPVYKECDCKHIERSGRYRIPKTRTVRYTKTPFCKNQLHCSMII